MKLRRDTLYLQTKQKRLSESTFAELASLAKEVTLSRFLIVHTPIGF